MKKQHFIAVVLSFVLVIFVLPDVALAGDVFRFKGQNADAFFLHTDGCIETRVGVFAGEETFHNPPGPGDTQSRIFIFVDQFDTCAGTLVRFSDAFTTLDPGAFQVNKLNSATLNATIELFDQVTYTSFTVNVNLSWTGTGAISRGNSHSHFQSPGCIFNSHANGTFRSAQASGSVSDGVTNFTPDPSVFASLSASKNGTVQIGCGG